MNHYTNSTVIIFGVSLCLSKQIANKVLSHSSIQHKNTHRKKRMAMTDKIEPGKGVCWFI